MTEKAVVFDTWAWIEVLGGSKAGASLRRKFLEAREASILTVDITLAEVSVLLVRDGKTALVQEILDSIRAGSTIVPVGRDDAVMAGPIRKELRETSHRAASTIDAVVLSVARNRGALLVSGDSAFAGQPDVVRS